MFVGTNSGDTRQYNLETRYIQKIFKERISSILYNVSKFSFFFLLLKQVVHIVTIGFEGLNLIRLTKSMLLTFFTPPYTFIVQLGETIMGSG
jgi:hypothetical protein